MLVTTAVPEQHTAWTKARRDVVRLCQDMGCPVLAMPERLRPVDWARFIAALSRLLSPGGRVLVEYPLDQRRRLYPLVMFCRLRRIGVEALIHDLDALRFDAPKGREIAILRLFDGLISHNPSMTAWLRESGITGPVAELGLFDYLAPGDGVWHADAIESPVRVACAGNLSFPKARYVYHPHLSELERVQLSLFGAFFEPERMPAGSSVGYRGVFDPDAPALDGRYHFGLVWDGDDIAQCSGRYGRYLRFNNPHKLSLYAALGLPVVVWREAAVARLVLAKGIGVTVGDLRELAHLADRVKSPQYQQMTRNMATIRRAVMRGDFLRRALSDLRE